MKKWQCAAYLTPALVVTAVFFIAPLFYLAFVSFYQWNGLGPMVFKGKDNFVYVFSDPVFHMSLRNTLLWIVSAVFLHVPLGLFLALILRRHPVGWRFLRVAFFIPNVISTTAVAFLWYFIFHVNVGLINSILRKVGLEFLAHPWLNNMDSALFANQVPFILYTGLTMIIFLTQITVISPELYEAAKIDGAGALCQDLYITIPLLKNSVITNLFLNIAFCLRNFEYPFLMTGGGPANSTMNLSLYIYKEMINANRYGISMVAGLVTVLIGAIIMLLVLFASGKEHGTKDNA